MWRPAAAAIRWPFVPMSAPRCRCCKPRWVAPGWRRRPRPCGARCWPCCAGTCRPPGPNGAPASGRPSNICSATAFASHMPTGRRVWLRGGWGGWGGGGGPAIEHRQRHGFCVSQADWQSDVYAVAVPLNAPADAEPVVINCGVPIRSLRPGELQSRVAPRLMALARRIEAHWRAATQPAMPVALPLEVVHGAVSGTVSHAHTLSRGLDLLQCFRPGEVQLGHAELTRRLRLPHIHRPIGANVSLNRQHRQRSDKDQLFQNELRSSVARHPGVHRRVPGRCLYPMECLCRNSPKATVPSGSRLWGGHRCTERMDHIISNQTNARNGGVPMQIDQSAAQSCWLRDIDLKLHVRVGIKVEKWSLRHQKGNIVESCENKK